jgi:murein DD-endopeptidase MepM/ murein hydrolase activator NlpD
VGFLAWIALAAGTLLVFSARRGTSPLRALLSGEPIPAPTYPIEGVEGLPKATGEASRNGSVLVSAAGLTRPVPGAITSGFGMRGVRMHYGVDIPAPHGTPIRAAMAGTVNRVAYDPGGAGNYVRVSHPNGWMTKYFHMSTQAAQVGQPVTAGQVIGYVGSTGNASGPHLHFELWIDGKAVDPQPYLDGTGTVSV